MEKPFFRKAFLVLLLILALAYPLCAEESLIRILHVNDFHGFAEPFRPLGSHEMLGGASYLASAVGRLRHESPSLLLSAGDMIQGNPWASLSRGESVVALMNAMKFDAMTVGNHEFDFGQDVLRKRIAEARFAVLSANLIGLETIKPYVVKNVGGVKVGILGVIAEDTPVLTHPANVMGLTFGTVRDAVQKYLPDVRKKSDIVIVLSHIGYEADRLLAEQVKGIDFIIGGHSHTRIADPPMVGGTMILQAWEHGKALGVLDISFDNGSIKTARGYLEEIKPAGNAADREVDALVRKYRGVVDSLLQETIGEAGADLDGENIRSRETNLGNLVADIIRTVSNADAALINSGAIRTSIRKGEIKAGDIYSMVPFDSYVVAVKLKGRQIREALEHGFSAVEKRAGAFPQVSGITLKYDLSAPPGSRIKEAQINGKSLGLDEEYVVGTLDFIAAGGDGYKAFGDAITSSKDYSLVGGAMKGEKLVYSDPGRWMRDLVIEYIKSHKKVSARIEGRMAPIETR